MILPMTCDIRFVSICTITVGTSPMTASFLSSQLLTMSASTAAFSSQQFTLNSPRSSSVEANKSLTSTSICSAFFSMPSASSDIFSISSFTNIISFSAVSDFTESRICSSSAASFIPVTGVFRSWLSAATSSLSFFCNSSSRFLDSESSSRIISKLSENAPKMLSLSISSGSSSLPAATFPANFFIFMKGVMMFLFIYTPKTIIPISMTAQHIHTPAINRTRSVL